MGNNTPKQNRPSETAADQKLVDGFTKHAATIPALMIQGQARAPAELVTAIQAIIAVAAAVTTTRAAWQNAVKVDNDERVDHRTFISAVRQALLVAFAGQVDVLADFGLTIRKKIVRTPEQKQAAAAKAKATRAARHTMGKKQKALVTGATQPQQGTPPAPTPAPAVLPAPTAPPAVNPAPALAPAAPVPTTPVVAPAPVVAAPVPPAPAPSPAPATAAPVTAAAVVAPAPAPVVNPPVAAPQPTAEPTPPKA